MHFRKIFTLRGPNIWANYPVLEAWLDLGQLKDSPSDELPGFNERLMSWLPSMIEHRCSEAERGGFFERLRRGTYQGHILEHVALELQSLAGTPVGFGRTRSSHVDGVYKVVVEYENEELGLASLNAALRICLAAVHDTPIDVAGEVHAVRELARRVLPAPTAAALLREARNRRIPVQPMTAQGVLRFGQGCRRRHLLGTQTDRTGTAAEALAFDRLQALELLQSSGIPVPAVECVDSPDLAWEQAKAAGGPVVVRPRWALTRAAAFRGLTTREQVEWAYREASSRGPVLVEREAYGAWWRLLVVGERLVSAVLCGTDRQPSGLSAGTDVTGLVHPDVAARAVEAAQVLGLDVAGIDVVTETIDRPLEAQKGAIVGVHPRPGLGRHLRQHPKDTHPAAEAILARLFPEGQTGRIPLAAVTGVNGKTTVTRLISHIMARKHRCVGMTCTEGIYIGGRQIEAGDCSGPQSARVILNDPRVDAAVLETARGGILRAGLGFDRCDVAVVTNIGEGDHLGLGDIETVEELARVKRVPVDAVHRDGAAVLKADDPLTAAMAEHCSGRVVFFCLDGNHPVLAAHRASGERAAFVRDGQLILADGAQEIPLVSVNRVPITHGGHIPFQVENCLAAAAAAWSLDVPCEQIRLGLESFAADMTGSPGRFNVFAVDGAIVVLDYGHNAASLACVINAIAQAPTHRRVAVYSTAGDRRDCDMIRQGELLGGFFDRIILFEDHYLRGRKEGEIIGLFRRGIDQSGWDREVEEVRGAVPAMKRALDTLLPGDLVLLQADTVDESVDYMRCFLEEYREEVREITMIEALSAVSPPLVAVPRRKEGRAVVGATAALS